MKRNRCVSSSHMKRSHRHHECRDDAHAQIGQFDRYLCRCAGRRTACRIGSDAISVGVSSRDHVSTDSEIRVGCQPYRGVATAPDRASDGRRRRVFLSRRRAAARRIGGGDGRQFLSAQVHDGHGRGTIRGDVFSDDRRSSCASGAQSDHRGLGPSIACSTAVQVLRAGA